MMHSKGKLFQEHFVMSGVGAVQSTPVSPNMADISKVKKESLWSILDMSDCQEPREQASVTMDDDKKIFKYVALF